MVLGMLYSGISIGSTATTSYDGTESWIDVGNYCDLWRD